MPVATTFPKIHRYEARVSDFFVNAYLVETENAVVAVDAALANSDAQALRRKIDKEIKKPLHSVLLTHGHPDHYTGIAELTKGLDVPIYSTQGALDFAKEEDERKTEVAIAIFGPEFPKRRAFPNSILKEGDTVRCDGVTFELRDYGPGESDDDALWVTKIAGVDHAFIGDIAYNNMHCFFRDLHAKEWLGSLDRLRREFNQTAKLYPGHGEICGVEVSHWNRGYILTFTDTLHDLLQGRDHLEPAEKDVLVAKMQTYLPNTKLLFLLTYELDDTIRLLKAKGVV
ncbi:MAG: MBL fold metallo-hydrolase [Opitutaceae bacterium]|jgi:glyoxylase-like metal-dependent hydrolase (beta-lactamase superfamily II)